MSRNYIKRAMEEFENGQEAGTEEATADGAAEGSTGTTPEANNSGSPSRTPKESPVETIERTEEELDSLKLKDPIKYPSHTDELNQTTSIEAFTEWMPGTEMMNNLSDYFTGFADKINEGKNKLQELVGKAKEYASRPFADNISKLSIYASNRQYFMISKTAKVYQPDGLGVGWLQYAKWLEQVSLTVSTIDKDLLGPVAEYLGKGINRPENFASLTFKPIYQKKDIEGIKGEMKKIFSGPKVEKVFWGKAFGNNNEAVEVTNVIRTVVQNADLLDPNTVQKSIGLIVERANIIANGMKKPDSRYILNKKQSEYISEVLYLCAQYVTLYGTVLGLIDEFVNCINLTARNLK